MTDSDHSDDGKGFLTRWSQRKQEAKQPERDVPAAEANLAPVRVVNGSISIPLPYIHKVTGNCGCRRHSRANQVGTSASSLASLKVTVAG